MKFEIVWFLEKLSNLLIWPRKRVVKEDDEWEHDCRINRKHKTHEGYCVDCYLADVDGIF